MPTREAWADAYYKQASSDWALFKELQGRDDVPTCHAYHYLQMATEKLAKAYRFRDTTTDLETLLTSHVGFPRFLNTFLLSPQMREEYAGRHQQLESIRRDCHRLARAVEQLAPAVDRGAKPQNTEYPWAVGERVLAPIDHNFPYLSLLRGARGRLFLKFIDRAFAEYEAQAGA